MKYITLFALFFTLASCKTQKLEESKLFETIFPMTKYADSTNQNYYFASTSTKPYRKEITKNGYSFFMHFGLPSNSGIGQTAMHAKIAAFNKKRNDYRMLEIRMYWFTSEKDNYDINKSLKFSLNSPRGEYGYMNGLNHTIKFKALNITNYKGKIHIMYEVKVNIFVEEDTIKDTFCFYQLL